MDQSAPYTAPRGQGQQPSPPRRTGWRTERWPLVLVGLGALAFLSFFLSFKNYSIPAGSMQPALRPGEVILTRRLLLPFAGAPGPGDLVVFPLPRDPSVDYVKRVVAAGGDTVQMRGGVLHLNGRPVRMERLADRVVADDEDAGRTQRMQAWRETLPNGRSYVILKQTMEGQANDTGVYQVPPGQLFVMGDNRDNSLDSRYPAGIGTATGTIPAAGVTARAVLVLWSGDTGRIGTLLGARADRSDAAAQ